MDRQNGVEDGWEDWTKGRRGGRKRFLGLKEVVGVDQIVGVDWVVLEELVGVDLVVGELLEKLTGIIVAGVERETQLLALPFSLTLNL